MKNHKKKYLLFAVIISTTSCLATLKTIEDIQDKLAAKKNIEDKMYIIDDKAATDRPRNPMLVLFTNRIRSSKDSEYKFYGNTIDPAGRPSYMSINGYKPKWGIRKCKTFKRALEHLNLSRDILVFVHGDGKLFYESVERCIIIQKLYDVNVIAFDWPSEDPYLENKADNFYNSLKNAEASAVQYGKFIAEIDRFIKHREKDIKSVSIMYHSMGNYVLQKYIENGYIKRPGRKTFNNIILSSPAVKQKGHADWVKQMNYQKNIYITINEKDAALNPAAFLLTSVLLGLDVEEPLAGNAHYIDLSNIISFAHTPFINSSSLEHQTVKNFYNALFHGKTIDLKNRNIFKRNEEIRVYEMLDDD